MRMEGHSDVAKAEKASTCPFCILEVINKFLDILMDNLPTILLPSKDVNHKIEVHPRSTSPTRAPYRLNQKMFEELKKQINDFME